MPFTWKKSFVRHSTHSPPHRLTFHPDNYALTFLYNLCAANAAHAGQPIFAPSPIELALAATLVVHPATTTRAAAAEHEQSTNTALQLLRLVAATTGPINARFADAFVMTHFESSRQVRQQRRGERSATMAAVAAVAATAGEKEGGGGNESVNNDGGGQPGRGEDLDSAPSIDADDLNVPLARTGSVWARAEDFWQAVGWAFNCAVRHPRRWARWRLWLEFMCEAMEADWAERERLVAVIGSVRGAGGDDVASSSGANGVTAREIFKESLVFGFIASTSSLADRHRRILRALFADGRAESATLFREVFPNELKEPVRAADKLAKKREVDVDIDAGQFGDYLVADDEDGDGVNDDDGGGGGGGGNGGGGGAVGAAGSAAVVSSAAAITTAAAGRPRRTKRARRTTSLRQPDEPDAMELDPSYQAAAVAAGSGSGPGRQENIVTNEGGTPLGDTAAVALRRRLLALLARVSRMLPQDFLRPDRLQHLCVEFVRHLPLPAFHLFLAPTAGMQCCGPPPLSSSSFSASSLSLPPSSLYTFQIPLCRALLSHMLQDAAPPDIGARLAADFGGSESDSGGDSVARAGSRAGTKTRAGARTEAKAGAKAGARAGAGASHAMSSNHVATQSSSTLFSLPVPPCILAQNLLPFAASSNNAVDNAKVSVLLEVLVACCLTVRTAEAAGQKGNRDGEEEKEKGAMTAATKGGRATNVSGGDDSKNNNDDDDDDAISDREALVSAMRQGLEARGLRAQNDARKRAERQVSEEKGLMWLLESGERLAYLVEILVGGIVVG